MLWEETAVDLRDMLIKKSQRKNEAEMRVSWQIFRPPIHSKFFQNTNQSQNKARTKSETY
jgi:hypothetical protein